MANPLYYERRSMARRNAELTNEVKKLRPKVEDLKWELSLNKAALSAACESGRESNRLLQKSKELLRIARCPDPNCDNKGTTIKTVARTTIGCCGNFLPSGECCGNGVPEPEEDIEPSPCQWCHERDEILSEEKESETK